ncbi:MAG: hypothetical protein M3256_05300 [Actinomycetota bacterium]|nr:hypothetical protein [Actinomycetota bacterium]
MQPLPWTTMSPPGSIDGRLSSSGADPGTATGGGAGPFGIAVVATGMVVGSGETGGSVVAVD